MEELLVHVVQYFRYGVMDLNNESIAEMRSYTTPPEVVRNVMYATLVLLGDDPAKLKVKLSQSPQAQMKMISTLYSKLELTIIEA